MKSVIKNTFQLIAIASFIFSCNDESNTSDNLKTLLVGQWNSYESGTQQTGFFSGITNSLTVAYESGISFSGDGTFTTRHHNNGVWSQGDEPVGTYIITDKGSKGLLKNPPVDLVG